MFHTYALIYVVYKEKSGTELPTISADRNGTENLTGNRKPNDFKHVAGNVPGFANRPGT